MAATFRVLLSAGGSLQTSEETTAEASDCFRAVIECDASDGSAHGVAARTWAHLDWAEIVEAVVSRCSGEEARELASRMGVLPTGRVAARRRAEVVEAMALWRRNAAPPVRAVPAVRTHLLRAERADILGAGELRQVAEAADAAIAVAAWCEGHASDAPLIREQLAPISSLRDLSGSLRFAFDETGEVADRASPDLGRLRRRVLRLREGILDRLERIRRDPRLGAMLQDDFVTIRDDRFVLPVRASDRSDIPGIVHGQSQSGATLFIEPEELVAANNEYRIAQLDVENEIRRVQERLTRQVERQAGALAENQRRLVWLDVTCAVARLCAELDCGEIQVDPPEAERGVRLVGARHPVLALRLRGGTHRLVANDVVVPAGARALVISGPNTGGKTVTLKLIGLFALMLRAGMPVPCEPESRMPEFAAIRSDVGDEQAVTRDLSTFSGHIANLTAFLSEVDGNTLVLLDELFGGTSPEHAAALGRALLDHLLSRGAWVVVTTHLDRLKGLAFEDRRYAAASVGFDIERMSPTWELRSGIPGASFAIEISRRLGLDAAIVDAAAEHLASSEHAPGEAVVAEMDRTSRRIAEERRAVAALRASLEEELAAAREERAHAQKRELRALDGALAGAREELRVLRELLRDRGAELRAVPRVESAEEAAALAARLESARAAVRTVEARAREIEAARVGLRARPRLVASELAPGAPVWVEPMGATGRVVQPGADGERVVVQLGAMRAAFDIAELRKPEPADVAAGAEPALRRGAFPPDTGEAAGADAPIEIDLRGAMVEEAIDQVDAWLDRAGRASLPWVRVIHGHGTGALRRALRKHLLAHRGVSAIRPGEPGEGGDGVTIATLR